MMTRAALALLLAAALAPANGWAQAAGDKVRLDDFALPRSAAEPVQQIAPPRSAVPAAQTGDRSLAVPALPARSSEPLPQVAAREGARPSAQLTPRGRTAAAPPPLSLPADSRPQAAVALTGKDRCDPQDSRAGQIEQCQRILELRAGEFSTREAPTLSAEQRILIEQQNRERRLPLQRSMQAGLTKEPDDANERANQELAAVVFGSPVSQPAVPEPEAATADAALADLLQKAIAGSSASSAP